MNKGKTLASSLYYQLFFLLALNVSVSLAQQPSFFSLKVIQKDLSGVNGLFAIGDIDKDGKADIIGTGKNPVLYWISGNDVSKRTRIFGAFDRGYDIDVVDVNNDGWLDVISSGKGVTWLENPKTGNFTSDWKQHVITPDIGNSYIGGSHDFKAGDIDNDGIIDAIERGVGNKFYWFWHQQPLGTWKLYEVPSSEQTKEGTAIGDIDNDGDLDISDGYSWSECPADPAKDKWTLHTIATANYALTRVVIADINGDKKMDIITAPSEYGGSELAWFESPLDPRKTPWTKHLVITQNNPNFHTLQVGDIDRDGNNDIFAGVTSWDDHPADWKSNGFLFLNTNGKGLDFKLHRWKSEKGFWQGVLGDVGSDGDLDLLSCDFQTGAQSEFWENTLCDNGKCGNTVSTVFTNSSSSIVKRRRPSLVIADRQVMIQSDKSSFLNLHGRTIKKRGL